MRKRNLEVEIKVGLFVCIGLGLIMMAIVLLGGARTLFSKQSSYYVYFDDVGGLITGSKVVLNGIRVGIVQSTEFDKSRWDIRVKILVERSYQDWIRADATAEIATQGVLGDKYISLNGGTQSEDALEPGSEIHNTPGKDLNKFLTSGEQLMASLNSIAAGMDRMLKNFESHSRQDTFFQGMANTAKNLSSVTQKLNQELDGIQIRSSIKNLNEILIKINNGNGTLGALINDPALYDDAKALVGGANRNRIVRNLVRKTIKDSEEEKK